MPANLTSALSYPPAIRPSSYLHYQYEDCVTVLVDHAALDIPTHDAIRPPGLRVVRTILITKVASAGIAHGRGFWRLLNQVRT